MSILTSYDRVKEGHRKVYIRMYGVDQPQFGQLKEELRKKTDLLYMVDLRENKREVYGF